MAILVQRSLASSHDPIVDIDGSGDVQFDPVLGKKPTGDNGIAWEIARLHGKGWLDAFRDPAGGESIKQDAKDVGVDALTLLIAMVALHGESPPSRNRLASDAKSFANRKPGQGLNAWLKQTNPARWKVVTERATVEGGLDGRKFRPDNIAKAVGYEVPVLSTPSEGSQNPIDRIRADEEWAAVIPKLENIAKGTFRARVGGTVTGIGINNLIATLWSQGMSAADVRRDLNNGAKVVRQNAKLLANFSTGTLTQFFEDEGLKVAQGRTLPDDFLGSTQTGRNIPRTQEEGISDAEKKLDVTDPKVAGPGGKPFTIGGVDLRTSQFNAIKGKYDDLSQFYRNRKASKNEVLRWVKSGISDHQLAIELTADKDFFRSPAWKGASVSYKGVFRDMIGQNAKLPKGLIRKAIVLKWSPGDFAEELRGRPEYLKSNEFNSQASSLQNIYATVMGGQVTPGVKWAIQEATLARWSENQFAAWLRQQPEYATGVEHTKKMQNFNSSMAAFFGTSQKRMDIPLPEPVAAFDLPDSKRIEGQGSLEAPDPNARPAESIVNPRQHGKEKAAA